MILPRSLSHPLIWNNDGVTNGHVGKIEIRDGSEWHKPLLIPELLQLQLYLLTDADLLTHRETRNLGIFFLALRVTKFLKNFFPRGKIESIH